jgi:hypothetical protein
LALCRDPMKTVWIYVDTSKEVAATSTHLKVFANEEAMEKWFREDLKTPTLVLGGLGIR